MRTLEHILIFFVLIGRLREMTINRKKDDQLMTDLLQELNEITAMKRHEGTNLELKKAINFPLQELENYYDNEINKYLVPDSENPKSTKKHTFNTLTDVQKYFERLCWKEVTSFLNSEGGVLYIGVEDKEGLETGERKIVGVPKIYPSVLNQQKIATIEENAAQSIDLKIRQLNAKLDTFFTPEIRKKYLSVKFLSKEGKDVLVINVMKANLTDWPILIYTGPENKKDNKLKVFVSRDNDNAIENDLESSIQLVKDRLAFETRFPETKNGWSPIEEPFQVLSFVERVLHPYEDKETIILHDKGICLDFYSQVSGSPETAALYSPEAHKVFVDVLERSLGGKVCLSFSKPYLDVLEESQDFRVNEHIEHIQILKREYPDFKTGLKVRSFTKVERGHLKNIWDCEFLRLNTEHGDFYALPQIFGYEVTQHESQFRKFYNCISLEEVESELAKSQSNKKFDINWFGDENWKFLVGSELSGYVIKFDGLQILTISSVIPNSDVYFDIVSDDKKRTLN
jgi:hypothetical protein